MSDMVTSGESVSPARSSGGRATAVFLFAFLIAAPVLSRAQTTAPAPGAGAPGVPTIGAGPVPQQDRAAVRFEGEELFLVGRVGSFSPAERARLIEQRIHDLASRTLVPVPVIHVVDLPTSTDILADELLLVTITSEDAHLLNKSRRQIADDAAVAIQRAIQTGRSRYAPRSLVLGAILALLATVAIIALIKVLSWTYRGAVAHADGWFGEKGLRIQHLQLMTREQLIRLTIGLFRPLYLLLLGAACAGYLAVVLSLFPWTSTIVRSVGGYVLAPIRAMFATLVAYIPNVFFLLVIVVVSHYAIKFVALIFREVGKGNLVIPDFDPEWSEPTYKIVRFLIIAFTAVVAFPYLPGAASPAFRGISLFLGLLLSLASSSAISNMIAGTILTYTNAFRVGDRVRIADTTGDVVEKTLLVTRLRTIKNVDVTIPNGMVLAGQITNYSTGAERGLILHTSVTIGYDAPWRRVHELLLGAAARTDGLLREPVPFILQTSLDDFYVTYELNVFTHDAQRMAAIYSDLHQNIQDSFNEGGVEIMSPHYEALRDGNPPAVPGTSADGGAAPRSFLLSLLRRDPRQ